MGARDPLVTSQTHFSMSSRFDSCGVFPLDIDLAFTRTMHSTDDCCWKKQGRNPFHCSFVLRDEFP